MHTYVCNLNVQLNSFYYVTGQLSAWITAWILWIMNAHKVSTFLKLIFGYFPVQTVSSPRCADDWGYLLFPSFFSFVFKMHHTCQILLMSGNWTVQIIYWTSLQCSFSCVNSWNIIVKDCVYDAFDKIKGLNILNY